METTTLDGFFAAEGWPPVHLIKMDIEGAEKLALEGMRKLVARAPNLKLIMEFAPVVQRAAGVSSEELFDTLSSLGFQKFSVIRHSLEGLSMPDDITRLVRMLGDSHINLLCEK